MHGSEGQSSNVAVELQKAFDKYFNNSLELNTLPERIPAEEWHSVGDFPHFDQAVAVVVRRCPMPMVQFGSSEMIIIS